MMYATWKDSLWTVTALDGTQRSAPHWVLTDWGIVGVRVCIPGKGRNKGWVYARTATPLVKPPVGRRVNLSGPPGKGPDEVALVVRVEGDQHSPEIYTSQVCGQGTAYLVSLNEKSPTGHLILPSSCQVARLGSMVVVSD